MKKSQFGQKYRLMNSVMASFNTILLCYKWLKCFNGKNVSVKKNKFYHTYQYFIHSSDGCITFQ